MRKNLKDRVTVSDGRVCIDNILFRINNIDFDNVLASGANAVIIKGKDNELDRPVIIKVWLIKSNDDRIKIRQGREESRKIAKLDHIRIAKVFTSGVFKDMWYYLVMEDLGDTTLRKELAKNPDFDLKYRFWYEIDDGISHAYEKNIYHGDLHSNNIMVFQNHIKILDFGTSTFNQKIHSLERDSKLIESLVKEIFNEFILHEFQDYSFKILKPENCLDHCTSWVEIMDALKKLTDDKIDDYKTRSFLTIIDCHISRNPLFSIKAILKFLNSIELHENYINTFLDHLKSNMQAKIDNQYSWETSPDLVTSIEQKIGESLILQKKLVSKYLTINRLR